MKVPWPATRCIICLGGGPLCEEHVIPQALGGQLTSKFLCKACNSRLGHELEHGARADHSILIAVKHLEGKIPTLAKQIIEGHSHVGYSKRGVSPGYIKKEEFRIKSTKLGDGSIIQPISDAEKTVRTIMRKSGYENAPIENAIAVFREAPENVRIEIVSGLDAIKWTVDRIKMDLSKAKLMNTLIPAKIAFEFLALHVGSAIYGDAPQLAEIRAVFLHMDCSQHAVRVTRLTSNKYEPFHGIVFEGNEPYAKVMIRIFGCLAFRVEFLRLAVGGSRFVYTHRLDTGEEQVGIVAESAR